MRSRFWGVLRPEYAPRLWQLHGAALHYRSLGGHDKLALTLTPRATASRLADLDEV